MDKSEFWMGIVNLLWGLLMMVIGNWLAVINLAVAGWALSSSWRDWRAMRDVYPGTWIMSPGGNFIQVMSVKGDVMKVRLSGQRTTSKFYALGLHSMGFKVFAIPM